MFFVGFKRLVCNLILFFIGVKIIFSCQFDVYCAFDDEIGHHNIAPKSSFVSRKSSDDNLRAWDDEKNGDLHYNGGTYLEVGGVKLDIRAPSDNQIQINGVSAGESERARIIKVKSKKLGIPGSIISKVISNKYHTDAIDNVIAVGSYNQFKFLSELEQKDIEEGYDRDLHKYIFIREDLLLQSEEVIEQALALAYAHFQVDVDHKEVFTEQLDEYLDSLKRKENAGEDESDDSIKSLIERQYKKWTSHASTNNKNFAAKMGVKKMLWAFSNKFNSFYQFFKLSNDFRYELISFFQSLQNRGVRSYNENIENLVADIWARFGDLLPVKNIAFVNGEHSKPIDSVFLPNGDVILVTGYSGSGKGSLVKALHDLGIEEGFSVGSEDYTCLFTAGDQLFAATSYVKHNQVVVNDNDDSKMMGKIRARAYGDSKENDIEVNWSSKMGPVTAVIELDNQNIPVYFDTDDHSVEESLIRKMNFFSYILKEDVTPETKVTAEFSNDEINPVKFFKVKHFIVPKKNQLKENQSKYLEVADNLIKRIRVKQNKLVQALNGDADNLIDHPTWIMEHLLYEQIPDEDKKILALLDVDTEFEYKQKISGQKHSFRMATMRYTGVVKKNNFGQVQFLFHDPNSDENIWFYPFRLLKMLKGRDNKKNEVEDDYSPSFRVLDENISIANIQNTRAAQEDRYINVKIDNSMVPVNGKGRFLAVLDGHGGINTVHMVEKTFPKLFEDALIQCKGDVKLAFKLSFEKLDEITKDNNSGTTVLAVYIPDDSKKVFYANLGDSQLLIRARDGRIIRARTHDLMSNQEEISRIKRLGASVDRFGLTVKHKGGTEFIEMSGSLGDSPFKDVLTKKPYVGSAPFGYRGFVALFTDGLLTGKKNVKEQCDLISSELERGEKASSLIKNAKLRGSQDNITAIVVSTELKEHMADHLDLKVKSIVDGWKNWVPSEDKRYPKHTTFDKNLLIGAVLAGVSNALIVSKVDDPLQKKLIELVEKTPGLACKSAPEYSKDSVYVIGNKLNVNILVNLLQKKYDGKIFLDDTYRTNVGTQEGFDVREIKRYLNVYHRENLNSLSRLEKRLFQSNYSFEGLFNPYTNKDFRVPYKVWKKGNVLLVIDVDDILISWVPLDFDDNREKYIANLEFQKVEEHEIPYIVYQIDARKAVDSKRINLLKGKSS